MAHKQFYVRTFNKLRYSSEIAVFDMSTVIFYNTLKTTTLLADAKTLRYFLPLGYYRFLSNSMHGLKFSSMIDTKTGSE